MLGQSYMGFLQGRMTGFESSSVAIFCSGRRSILLNVRVFSIDFGMITLSGRVDEGNFQVEKASQCRNLNGV